MRVHNINGNEAFSLVTRFLSHIKNVQEKDLDELLISGIGSVGKW